MTSLAMNEPLFNVHKKKGNFIKIIFHYFFRIPLYCGWKIKKNKIK